MEAFQYPGVMSESPRSTIDGEIGVPEALHAFLRERRSVRHFTGDTIDPAAIARILESATWAPSAHNRQPWRFVLLGKRADRERIANAMGDKLRADRLADDDDPDVVEADVKRSRSRIVEAPVVVFVFATLENMDAYPDDRRRHAEQTMAIQSTAMATQNMLLASHAEGLGACVMCAPLFARDVVVETLKVPANWWPQALVTIGRAATVRESKGRLSVDAVVIPQ